VRSAFCAFLLLGSCSQPANDISALESPLAGSWADQIVSEPSRFNELMQATNREGWIAFHSNDYRGAAKAFQGDGPSDELARARALWELALLFEDLARTGDLAWRSTFATWTEKSSIPAGSALTYVAGLASRDQGDHQVARAWLKLTANAKDPQVAQAAAALLELDAVDRPLQAEGEQPPLMERFNAHVQARETGAIEELLLLAAEPLVTETETTAKGRPLERKFWDPQILRSAASGYRLQVSQLLQVEEPLASLSQPAEGALPMAALLFGPAATSELLSAEAKAGGATPNALGANGPQLQHLGLAAAFSETDDQEWTRRHIRELDVKLDAWVEASRASANADGVALLDDVQLVVVFRSRLLLALARKAILADHPRQAKVYAQQALDVESSRGISPVNHPGLLALIVESQLRTGHTREALDALQPLVESYPCLTGLDEVMGDLAILQGLDRYGDSKEN